MTDQDVLVADIGGTNARLAVARVLSGGAVTLQQIEVRKSADHTRIADLIAGYGARLGTLPGRACLAIAGPVSDGVGRVTNAGLTADAAELQRELGLARVVVMNDFAALANAVPQLAPGEVSVVKDGEAKEGEPISVMGAGTGFGCALLPPCGGRFGLVATEGGHASFSPTDDTELRLWQWLRQHMDHVSVEAVLSGPGLAVMHRALREFEGVTESLSPSESGLPNPLGICRAQGRRFVGREQRVAK
jgi:glucokinase